MSSEMIILTRTYDLLKWLLPRMEKFPKVYRRNVSARLIDAALDFQEALFDAQAESGNARLRFLRKADAQLNKVRCYLRLCLHWQMLSRGQYEHVSRMVAEIGRLLGGWMKAG